MSETDRPDMAAIRALLARLPEGLRADWDGSAHYELHQAIPGGDWWWLTFPMEVMALFSTPGYWCDTETGQRIGLVLDTAAAYRPHVEALLAEVERLTAVLQQIGERVPEEDEPGDRNPARAGWEMARDARAAVEDDTDG